MDGVTATIEAFRLGSSLGGLSVSWASDPLDLSLVVDKKGNRCDMIGCAKQGETLEDMV